MTTGMFSGIPPAGLDWQECERWCVTLAGHFDPDSDPVTCQETFTDREKAFRQSSSSFLAAEI
jgi:hypothetical protein